VVDVATMNGIFGGSYPARFRNWDMISIGGDQGQFIYIPHEVSRGAGITRYNRDTGSAAILLQGDASGSFSSDPGTWSPTNDDFATLDPAVLAPDGSLITAEEGGGNGRLFRLSNPETATGTGNANWQWLSNIPSVSHEGIKFDSDGNLYFIDENNSGSVYRFVPTTPGIYSQGQTSVLSITAYNGNADENFNSAANTGTTRTGAATWVAITDANGSALTLQDPFDFSSRGGRLAADELDATPYGRPEDLEIGLLANGNTVLYFATTSENIIYSIELDPNGSDATVREFVNSGVTPDRLGNSPVGTGANDSAYGLDDPDNLAIDAWGNLYILEDETPGDIWQAIDADGDGVAESVARLASLGPFGPEPTGFIADPRDPYNFLVAVQHPASGNDALWQISADAARAAAPLAPTPLLLLGGLGLLASVQRRRRTRAIV
jgi:hypothetical protein